MIWTAALLIRKHGVAGTSFSDVIERSGAPRGSIYHHFPGGKAQLVEEATRYAGEFTAAGLAAALSEPDPVQAIHRFVTAWAAVLRRSEFAAGCPVVAAALAEDAMPSVRDAAAAAFSSWEELLTAALARHLPDLDTARELATTIIAAVEGAVILARAQSSTEPLERVAATLERLLRPQLQPA